jgi:uncharacterized protein YndB with AHSA1/START domain
MRTMHVHKRITVERPRPQVYAFWRNLTQLPQFMDHLASVQGDTEGVTHWRAKGPGGSVEWDAELVEDKPNELISWRSLEGSDVRNSGAVRFFDAGSSATEVAVDISYDPPMGRLGNLVASILGESPEQEIGSDLKRFKEIMESGQADISGSPAPTVPADVPTATAAGQELAASRGETHAATNQGRYETDLNPQKVDNDAQGDELIIGGPMMANPGYSSTGLVGATDPAEAGVIGATRGSVPGSDSDLANDVDPDQLGLRRGHDQNKVDPNDRDLGNPDAPEHDIGYRPSGAPL